MPKTAPTKAKPAAAAPVRKRDPQGTRDRILAAARDEFCERSLDGARVDTIAERADINKRMLYHYFGNKQDLYCAVLERAYQEIRSGERELRLETWDPVQGMEHLVRFTFQHFLSHPWFIRLLITENIQEAQYLKTLETIRAMHSPLVAQIADLLRRGEADGRFRKGVDAVQLYITIAALGFFYLSNIHTLSVIFATDLKAEANLQVREAHIVDVVMSYLRA